MTKVKIVVDEVGFETPKFEDLDISQYFHKFGSDDECNDVYIKLPQSKILSNTGATFNAYNLSRCQLKYITSDERCICIDNVEIHI